MFETILKSVLALCSPRFQQSIVLVSPCELPEKSLTVDCSFFVSAFSSLWFDQVITLQPIYLWLRKRPESFTADRLCSHKSFQRKSGVGWKQFQRETTKTGNI